MSAPPGARSLCVLALDCDAPFARQVAAGAVPPGAWAWTPAGFLGTALAEGLRDRGAPPPVLDARDAGYADRVLALLDDAAAWARAGWPVHLLVVRSELDPPPDRYASHAALCGATWSELVRPDDIPF